MEDKVIKADQVNPKTEDMHNDYCYDCGICAEVFTWQEYKDNNLFCPHCGWDSVRIARK